MRGASVPLELADSAHTTGVAGVAAAQSTVGEVAHSVACAEGFAAPLVHEYQSPVQIQAY